MQTVGAKVLHNRCIQIGKKFESNIIAKSTFSNEGGTKICQQIESTEVKSIVKNEKLVTIQLQVKSEYDIYQGRQGQGLDARHVHAGESNFFKSKERNYCLE